MTEFSQSDSRSAKLPDDALMVKIREHWAHLRTGVKDAINLAQKMGAESCLQSDHDFQWALVKHVENAQEAVSSLDAISSKKLFPILVELPLKADNDELSWHGLIGMRQVLVHQPWAVDHAVVWRTATEEFPPLLTLIESTTIAVKPTDVENGRGPKIDVSARKLISGARTVPGDKMALTGSQVLVFRDVTHGFGALHVGLAEGTSALVGASPEWVRKKWSMRIGV